MTNKPQNMELLAQHGTNTFDVDFLDKPGGSAIQPSRNGNSADIFDPTILAQSNPADFITPSVKIWDGGTAALIAVPGGYNAPLLTNLRYAGSKGKFLIDMTGVNTRKTADLVNQKWAIVYDSQINGFAFRTYEFFTVLPDGDAAFSDFSVTVADVMAGYQTTLDSGTLQTLLDQASSWATGRLKRKHGILATDIDTSDESVREGIILRSRWLMLTYDISAGLKPTEAQEATERIKFGGRSDAAMANMLEEAKECIDLYGVQNAPGRKTMIQTIVTDVGPINSDGPNMPFWFPP